MKISIALGTAILVISLIGAVPASQASESAVAGTSSVTDDTITSTAWDTLLSKDVVIPGFPASSGSTSHCVANRSSDAANPLSGDDNRYDFTLSVDTSAPASNSGSERTIEFDKLDTSEEEERIAVSSTGYFGELTPGTHTFRWLARKDTSGAANMVVEDSSLTIICTDLKI
jgi:hypothetical protein